MKATEQYFCVVPVFYAAQGGSNFYVCEENPSVTIIVKAIEQFSHVVLFMTLYKALLTLSLLMKPHSPCVTIQLKAIYYTCLIAYFSSLLVHWRKCYHLLFT